MKQFNSLIEAIDDLRKRGFNKSFSVQEDCSFCLENGLKLEPSDFEIVEFYRFEAETDPEDSSVIYAIQSDKKNIKGVLIDAYGAYANSLIADVLKKIKMKSQENITV